MMVVLQEPGIQYTLTLFEKLFLEIPPLVPEGTKKDMENALDQMQHNLNLTMNELEDTMIAFGKKIWPYRKAYDEFYDLHEGKLGEQFLLHHLTAEMKKKYREFLAYGGTYRDLHSGKPATYFSSEERGQLCTFLVEVSREIDAYTKQAILSTEETTYNDRITEFQKILVDIEKKLDTLRLMAENEQEHPELAAEIRSQIRSFEYGLCLLGPSHTYEAVCNAEEHFIGRKMEKKMRAHV